MVKRALILGSANCLLADIDAATDLSEFDVVIAAKAAAHYWQGPLDAWVTLHPDRMPKEVNGRRNKGLPDVPRIYAHRPMPLITHVIDYKFPGQRTSGSSGLFALHVAIRDFGTTHNVLCGIPMDKTFGRLNDNKYHWGGSRVFRRGWEEVASQIKNNTRSMSGWTKQLLGAPTAEWLSESR